ARTVVLTVRDQEDRLLRVRAARHLVDAKINGVVEPRLPVRLYEGRLWLQRIAVARVVEEELRAIVKAYEEILVARVARLDEFRQRLARLVDLVAAHRAGNVEDDAERDGRVLVGEESYLLRDFVVRDREGVLAESRYEAPEGVCDGHGASH